MRRTIEIAGIVGNGNTVNQVQLPMQLDYLSAYIVVDSGTVTAAQITDTKVIANGDILQQISGTFRDVINQFYRLTAFGGTIFRIPFEMIGMKSVDASYSPTLATWSTDKVTGKSITSARFEWTCSGATNPVFRFFADVDDSRAGGAGFIERINAYSFDLAGSEVSLRTLLPFGTIDRRFWGRLFFETGGTAIDLARILYGNGNEEVFKRTSALNSRIQTDGYRTPGAAFEYAIDFTETGIVEILDTMVQAPDQVDEKGNVVQKGGLVTCGNVDMRVTGAGTAAGSTVILATFGKF